MIVRRRQVNCGVPAELEFLGKTPVVKQGANGVLYPFRLHEQSCSDHAELVQKAIRRCAENQGVRRLGARAWSQFARKEVLETFVVVGMLPGRVGQRGVEDPHPETD